MCNPNSCVNLLRGRGLRVETSRIMLSPNCTHLKFIGKIIQLNVILRLYCPLKHHYFLDFLPGQSVIF